VYSRQRGTRKDMRICHNCLKACMTVDARQLSIQLVKIKLSGLFLGTITTERFICRSKMQKLTSIVFIVLILLSSLVYSRPSACTRPNSTEISYRGDGDELDETYDALVACPNTIALDLDFDWSGCTPPSEPWAFQFKPEDRFPSLQKLSL
jgi:hypothetical protein